MKSTFLYKVIFWISISGLLVFIADYGFKQSDEIQHIFDTYYYFVILLGFIATGARYVQKVRKKLLKVIVFDIVFTIVTAYIFIDNVHTEDDIYHWFWHPQLLLKILVIITFIRELSEQHIDFKKTALNPAQIFIASFIALILFGSALLLLPNATNGELSLINAIFTSTSAVCVTGLAVVDTYSFFTDFGKTIILVLIQMGGLGILTFASYFSFFFKGSSSYQNQLVIGDMTSSKMFDEVFDIVKYILIITFGIELASAVLIYLSVSPSVFSSEFDRIFFSVFHSISSFCNAGFSTLPDGMYNEAFRFNYSFQTIIILTFMLGGLGFPIVTNILNYLKYRILFFIRKKDEKLYRPWLLNLNSRITIVTTLTLFIVPTFLFFFLEYSNTLKEHNTVGKIVNALFIAATPRTAGFNTVDMASLAFPTIMVIFLLMWIGASPKSTGGGIKTSTFAIATLNIISLARGRSRIEVYRREIAGISVRRAFATISLSLIVIGLGIMLIAMTEPHLTLKNIAFECFSAYSTVGLSLGITGDLTSNSKLTLIVIMFIGRVSMLSVLIAMFRKTKIKNYRYPTEEITIN